MELAESTNFQPTIDRRKQIPVPPPVRLVTVDDAHLLAPSGLEWQLDAFYVRLLQFERDSHAAGIAYRAENFRLIIEVTEGPVERDGLRILGVEIRSLDAIEAKLRDAKIDYTRERGLQPCEERILLQDPSGNWLALHQSSPFF